MKMNEENIVLSDEQENFIKKAVDGCNILVDACIGSGKTTAIQTLCNELPQNLQILYLTYNKLLKIDAQSKIKNANVYVTNYHGFAYQALRKMEVKVGQEELITAFNTIHPRIDAYDVLILDEYQDIDSDIASMLQYIKETCQQLQIIAVGDMEQKIYDYTILDIPTFIDGFLDNYIKLEFTKCFRLSAEVASKLGRIWKKKIVGVNDNCNVEYMTPEQVTVYLSQQPTENILCLGHRTGKMSEVLNELESNYPDKFNKKTVYASIRDRDVFYNYPKKTSAIFTTYDMSKGMERPICVVFDYTYGYWKVRSEFPNQKYEILRNIFCVAASRGKQHIIFVKKPDEKMLEEETISDFSAFKQEFKPFFISEMFDFVYTADVDYCFSLLKIAQCNLEDDNGEIRIKNKDELIDLSPCIGIYQEATFFSKYSIDDSIKFMIKIHRTEYERMISKIRTGYDIDRLSFDEKILLLSALETKQERYFLQVNKPFVAEDDKILLHSRLSQVFSRDENVQVGCELPFFDNEYKLIPAFGGADVVKNDIVYELKYVSELSHKHFLQCACYVVALGLKSGVLWNTRNNTMFEIRVPDRELFLKSVIKTITKRQIEKLVNAPESDGEEKYFAVIDIETNTIKQPIAIGVVIAESDTFREVESKYYIIEPQCYKPSMYYDSLVCDEYRLTQRCTGSEAISDLLQLLNKYEVKSLMAYNAAFDQSFLPELGLYYWYDIMKIAAYRQYNKTILETDECCSTGRLKTNYKVENILRRLTGNDEYQETHNALYDARDELKILQLLGCPFDTYKQYANIATRFDVSKMTHCIPSPRINDKELWTIDDLKKRYNVSRRKIIGGFINLGLPYCKDGRKYLFVPEHVKLWEWRTQSITYRRKKTVLPEYQKLKPLVGWADFNIY